MVLIKEYRICMPISVEEYKIGQLYMVARHSDEQSENGEGVETVANIPCEDAIHGVGQYTEKRIHLSSRLPYFLQAIIPRVLYVTEKAWNYYPYTVTEYSCSFSPKLSVVIKTKFEDNCGSNDNCFDLSEDELKNRTVDFVDIAYDEVSPKHYKEQEDLKFFQSRKTGRGPLGENWQSAVSPIMCSYKLVETSFEIWGLQTRAENYIHSSIREILLLGHRHAFAWIDEWIDMTLADVRLYECDMQRETNSKFAVVEDREEGGSPTAVDSSTSSANTPSASLTNTPSVSSANTPSASHPSGRSWFSWA